MAQVERIVIEVTSEELKKALERKNGKTWRELFLPAIGVETKRETPGPDRKTSEG